MISKRTRLVGWIGQRITPGTTLKTFYLDVSYSLIVYGFYGPKALLSHDMILVSPPVFLILLPFFLISAVLAFMLIREIDKDNKKKEKKGLLCKGAVHERLTIRGPLCLVLFQSN